MKRLSTTVLLNLYHHFDREFWLNYKTLEALSTPETFKDLKVKLMRGGFIPDKYIENKEAFARKKLEIDDEWRLKSEDAKAEGTKVHETLLNAIISDPKYCKTTFGLPTDVLQVCQSEQFSLNDGIYTEYKMEVPIDDWGLLVGVADVIIKLGNRVKIIDYKTSDKIDKKSRYDMKMNKKKCLSYPLCKIEDCNYNVYTLLLSIYAWMLQLLYPDLEIESLEIYHVKDYKLKLIYPVEYWKETVDKFLHWHVKNAKLKEELLKCLTIYYNELL